MKNMVNPELAGVFDQLGARFPKGSPERDLLAEAAHLLYNARSEADILASVEGCMRSRTRKRLTECPQPSDIRRGLVS